MQIISFLAFGSLFAQARGHAGHDDQVPLDYVKFPFQPIYRGRNGEGELPSYLRK
jgi:agmatinase